MGGKMREKSIFIRLFGDSPKLRVLDFLMSFPKYDYSLTDISKNARIGYSTLMLFWEKDFVKTGLVVETRKVGKARMFKINETNPAIKYLLKLDWALSKYAAHKLIKCQEIVA